MVSKGLTLGLRGIEFLWILIALALLGSIIASANHGNPAVINFDMFVVVFAILSLLFFIPTTIMSHDVAPMLTIALDAVNCILIFLAAVITAAILGVHSCGDKQYTKHNKITNGSDDMAGRCRKAQASTAFLFFAFFTFLVTTAFSFMNRGGGSIGSVISRPSAMSQV